MFIFAPFLDFWPKNAKLIGNVRRLGMQFHNETSIAWNVILAPPLSHSVKGNVPPLKNMMSAN